MTRREALRACIKATGSHSLFAKALGLRSVGTVSGMLQRGYLPARHVLSAEQAWGVSRHHLRPDLYGAAVGSQEAA